MTIMIEFIIYADDFPIDDVINRIGINKYECSKKGNIVFYGENKDLQRVEECSSILYSTDYIETNDVKKPTEKILNMLLPVSEQILECIKQYNLNTKFCIVINLTDNPIIELSNEFIKLASKFNAFIEFDSYLECTGECTGDGSLC